MKHNTVHNVPPSLPPSLPAGAASLTTWVGLCSVEPGVGTPHGAWDLEEVQPRSGEGGVNADEGVSRAGEGGRGTWGEWEM